MRGFRFRLAAGLVAALVCALVPAVRAKFPTPQTGKSGAPPPAAKVDTATARTQVRDAIAIIESRLAAMDALYGEKGAPGTLAAAFNKHGAANVPAKDATAAAQQIETAWKEAKTFYQSNLKDLQNALAVFDEQKFAWQSQLDAINSGMTDWKKRELGLQKLLRDSVDLAGQRAALLAQAAKGGATAPALQKRADGLTGQIGQMLVAVAATGIHQHEFGTIKASKEPPPGGKPAKPSKKPALAKTPAAKKPAKTKPPAKPKDKGKATDTGKTDTGGNPETVTSENSVTVCKCSPSAYPFTVQTIDETIETSNPAVATARIKDGRLEITGLKYGEATITVKGSVVKYNTGIPEAPPPGKGGIHGNPPNSVPLNGNYNFVNKIHVKVICDLNGKWQGPMGIVTIIDSCGKVTLAAGKAVFTGKAELGSKGYGKIRLTHALELAEVDPSMPEEVRQQVVGHEASIEGTVGEGEDNIQANLVRDNVHWVKNDDGSYSVTFPDKAKTPVVFTRVK